jgi:hypothetical protein
VKRAILLFAINFIVVSSTLGTPQFEKTLWRQKVLMLRSTRPDVEKAFGMPSSGQGYLVSYKLNDGMLDIEYYPFDHCKPSNGVPADLNVPEWTVTEVVFRPDDQRTIASLRLNLQRFREAHLNPHVPDLVSYLDDKEGIEYTVDSIGRLNNVRYFPGSHYDRFRCRK